MAVRIALDAVGGDNAPREVLLGAREVIREGLVEVILVGPPRVVQPHIDELALPPEHCRLHPAEEMVGMDETPSLSLRKRDSSIQEGLRLVSEGQADAFLSAGNSGAIMAAALLTFGRLEGVKRPPLAAILPGREGPVFLVDAGANVDCSSEQLLQFALLAERFVSLDRSIEHPRVALLSNGEETHKGNEVVKRAHEMLAASGLRFVGNIEGKDILQNIAEVVVADGFLGNVTLKAMEGTVEVIFQLLDKEISASVRHKTGALLLRPALSAIKERMDYSKIGAAPLLGLNGLAFISHGRSKAPAFANGIRLAARAVEHDIVQAMRASLAQYGEKRSGN
ncbi:MAG: phosphate acyltransferase PlsX [Coprothermobacterota bacterium]|nr:phosphate acyltransferase PlsX [Coprothermobacterota bacterium]